MDLEESDATHRKEKQDTLNHAGLGSRWVLSRASFVERHLGLSSYDAKALIGCSSITLKLDRNTTVKNNHRNTTVKTIPIQ